MRKETEIVQHKVRLAIGWLHHAYHKTPWIFMTEADIQCHFYACLLKYSSKARRVIVRDGDDQRLDEPDLHVLTRGLHAELSSSRRRATEYVDLCLLDPSRTTFWIKKSNFSRSDRSIPVWGWDWQPNDSVGIEIKFNRWIAKAAAFSRLTKRTRMTQRWRDFRTSLVRDFKKLRRYKRGWLIFVDHYSLFPTRKSWRVFLEELIRDSNYDSAKRTLNAYYLCPKLRRPLSYKAAYNSF